MKMVLFSIFLEDKNSIFLKEKHFHFDDEVLRHYKRMIGMVNNFDFRAGHTTFRKPMNSCRKFHFSRGVHSGDDFILRCKNGSFFDFDTRRKRF